MSAPVLSHRVMATAQADLLGQSTAELIGEVVAGIPVPVEADNVT